MSIFRVVKDKDNPYVMINKAAIRDKNLSMRSKGLLAYLLSMPDDWRVYENELVDHFKDGRDAIRAGIKELIATGYIERAKIRGEKGTFGGYEYRIYEVSHRSGFSNNGKSNIGESNTTNTDTTEYINKKDIIHHLDRDNPFISFYLDQHIYFLGKYHVRVTDKQEQHILNSISELAEVIDYDDWQAEVTKHFAELPKGNNGNILAFLKASFRHFEIAI